MNRIFLLFISNERLIKPHLKQNLKRVFEI